MTDTTTNRKAVRACDTDGLPTDTTGAYFPMPEAQSKEFATLAASFALKGHAVHKGRVGDFTVTRWGMCRYCRDLAELQAFAERVGVQ